jgi:hypothetical protein
MARAVVNLPWVTSREGAACVARHLGCTAEDAERRIVDEGEAGRVRARGVTSEDYSVSLLPAAWCAATDLAGTTMRPPGDSGEITTLELCFIDLVATGLLPAPAERARWQAEEAVAYLVKGVPLPWKEWQQAGATYAEIEQAEIDLGQAIREGVPAWGWHPVEKKRKRIPSDDFRDERIEMKVLPVSVAHRPKVVVHITGNVGTWPSSRIADYTGTHWSSVEYASTRLRQWNAQRLAEPKERDGAPEDIRFSEEEWAETYTAEYIEAERKAGRVPTLTGLRQAALNDGKSGVRKQLDDAFHQQFEVRRGRRRNSAE